MTSTSRGRFRRSETWTTLDRLCRNVSTSLVRLVQGGPRTVDHPLTCGNTTTNPVWTTFTGPLQERKALTCGNRGGPHGPPTGVGPSWTTYPGGRGRRPAPG